jgi:hypothetical protein
VRSKILCVAKGITLDLREPVQATQMASRSSSGITNQTDAEPANGAVECGNTQTGRSADDVDRYRFGPWHDCVECKRRYRPVHPSQRCYDCRSAGKLSGTVDLTGP